VILMFVARFGLKSWFFQTPRESDPGPTVSSASAR
jgi:hypothetical protein